MNKELTTEQQLALRHEVAAMISEVDRTHRYSMSLIYGLYNRVNNTEERPQSCASCLIRKVNQLRDWLVEQEKIDDEKPKSKPRSRRKKV